MTNSFKPTPSLTEAAVLKTLIVHSDIDQKLRWAHDNDLCEDANFLQVQYHSIDWTCNRRRIDEHTTTELLEQLRKEAEARC